jgi:hypothetical protein
MEQYQIAHGMGECSMERSEVRKLSAVCRVGGPLHAPTRPDLSAFVGAKRQCLMEVQWQGRSGRFRHLALSPPGLRRVLGTFGIVAFLVLALGGAWLVGSKRAPAHLSVSGVLRESAELEARQDVLRERAFELAEQLYGRVEQGPGMSQMADTPAHVRQGRCPSPPSRKAGNEAVLAWLSEYGTRLESIGDTLTTGRRAQGAKQAPGPAPAGRGWATVRGESALLVADMRQARPEMVVPSKR